MNAMFTIAAPAKINLSLRVLQRREDGFHEIETLMVKLPELYDTLTFFESNAYSLTCSDVTVPVDERNLVTKAHRLFCEASGAPCHYRIHLEKRIPHGAGLAGGSSDAASMLEALNELSGNLLQRSQLLEIAAKLGSDIPFFLGDGAMWCKGRGEILEPHGGSIPTFNILLLKPTFGVSTPDAYKRWKDSEEIQGFHYASQTLDGLSLVNDLERPVFEKHLFLGEMKNWLREQEGVRAAMMSGSGSTVFALVENAESAKKLASLAKRELDPTLWSWHGRTGE